MARTALRRSLYAALAVTALFNLISCDSDEFEPDRVVVNVSANLPEAPRAIVGISSDFAAAAIPVSVGSVALAIRSPGCGDGIVYSQTQNTTPGQETVTFSLALPTGSTACFLVSAYSDADGGGTLNYDGFTADVSITGGGPLDVQVDLAFVQATPPIVATLPPTSVASASATFEGTVNPRGFEAVGYFEWGVDTTYGSTTPIKTLGAGTIDVALTQVVSGLTPGATYHYRAVAASSGTTVFGQDQTFTTPAAGAGVTINFPTLQLPTATTDPAGQVTSTSALLNATVNPQGTATMCHFEWGLDTTYGNTTSIQSLGLGAVDVFPQAGLTGLPQGTTLHYRIVAYNAGGLQVGSDATFVTPSAATPNAGSLVINEIMYQPAGVADADGEWIEIYNPTVNALDLTGLTVTAGTFSFVVPASYTIAAGGYFVFGRNADTAVNGGVTVDYVYPNGLMNNNNSSTITLTAPGGVLVDTAATYPPATAGSSQSLDPASANSVANDNQAAWCAGVSPYGTAGNNGTPRAANGACL